MNTCINCERETSYGSRRPANTIICNECNCGVYSIACPDTGDVVYVGASINMRRRFKDHKYGAQSEKTAWFRGLRAPATVEILEVCDAAQLLTRERHWTSTMQLIGMSLRLVTHDVTSNITGQRFGSWTVFEQIGNGPKSASKWLCKCDCGRERAIRYSNLKAGHSRSCGGCRWTYR